nr:glycosyltransferase [Armatimonas rosea]
MVVSHSCVREVNQQLFIELSRLPGVELELVVPETWDDEYGKGMFRSGRHPEATFPIHFCPTIKPGHITFHAYPKLPMAAFKKFAPDLVYSTQEPWSLSNLQFLMAARSLKAKFVYHTNQNLLKKYPPPFSWFEQLSYKEACASLAYSEEARQVLLTKGLKGPSFVVPYGTNVDQFVPGREEALREKLGLGDSVVVGYIGRFVEEKGVDLIVKALPKLPANTKILLVGTGSEEQALKSLAKELGVAERVVFTGGVPHNEADKYLRCMDIMALPSLTRPHWKEQFGRVLIEALACEVAVVGSDSGEIPNVVRNTGGGLVCKEGSVESLTECLSALVNDPARRLAFAKVGCAVVHSQYTFGAVARQLQGIFAEAL